MKKIPGGNMFKGMGIVITLLLGFQFSWAQTDDVIVVDSTEDQTIEAASTVSTEVETKAENDTPKKNVEKIEVTGSHIKRVDVEGPSPIVTIDSELFENAGVNTVTDMVRESPLFERSSEGGYFRFHGQHAGNTLILLNGMRVPKLGAPGSDFYNGIQGIPTNVIDRVEILKDGSSATYGSDAIAGVVNFITKKDYDGAEFSSRLTVPEAGARLEQNYTMAFGKNYNRGNWFTSVQYVNQTGATQADIGSRFQGNVYNGIVSSGTIRPKGSDRLEIGATCTDSTGNSVECDEEGDLNRQLFRNPKENIASLITGRYDITSDLSVSVLGMYNRQLTQGYGNPYRINFNERENGQLDLSKLNGNSLSQKLNGDTGLADVSLEPFEELGFSESNTVEDTYSVQARAEQYFGDTWSVQGDISYASMVQTTNHTNGIANVDTVRGMLESGAYDPTLPLGQKNNVLAPARVTPREQYVSDLMMARLVTSGEMFDFNNIWGVGGPVSIAFGAEAQRETVGDRNDSIFFTDNLTRPLNPNQNGERQIQSGFIEMTAYPVQSLELQLAGRYDNYSDFGDIVNPKFALAYRPSKKVMFRGSWGTNFHAPSIRNMIFQEDRGFERFRDSTCKPDPAAGKRCSSRFVPTSRYRHPEIGPEKGQHYNFGTVIQPNRNWAFTIDQWNFQGTDTIAKIYGDRYTQYEDLLGPGVLDELGVEIIRNDEGEIESFRAPEIVNLGERTIRGLDLKVDFNSKMNLFGLPVTGGASFDHSHFLLYKTKRFKAIPWEHRDDLEWKNTTSAFISTTSHYYRVAARTVAGGNGNHRSGVQIPTHTEYDFTYAFTASWGGKFSVGVKNILNSSIPNDSRIAGSTFISGSGSRDFDAFNPIGRRYFMGYGQTF